MKNLELNLGKTCQNRCVFCATGAESRGERGWMSLPEAQLALEQGRNEGAESVGFVGGEPTLHPELNTLVALARELGYRRVALCTNGRRLARPSRLEGLLEAGLSRVALSVHSHRGELEDRITGRPGAFEQKLAALEGLVAARDDGRLPDGLSLNTVLHAQNVTELDRLSAFFGERGIDDLRLNFIRPEVAPEEARQWVPTFARTTPRLRQLVVDNETRLGLRITFADLPLCRLPWELLANPHLRRRYLGEPQDLETRVAMHRPAGRGGTKRFDWRTQRVSDLKQYVPVCDNCRLRSRCEGVWQGYVALYGDAELSDGPTVARAFRGR